MDWSKIGKSLLSKKRFRKEMSQKDPYERDYSKLSNTDRRRAEAVDRANKKLEAKKKRGRLGFSEGGISFDKLKERLKKKK